jgi:2-amino-4-hydroxy-6-hydroxymethyldihydropteridine diphosphokinase
MTLVFIAMGSDVDPSRNLPVAAGLLAKRMRVTKVSNVYSTRPIGMGGARFYNCVIEADSKSSPREIKFGVLRDIEANMGRARGKKRYEPRPIDLDLIMYGDIVADGPDLVLPDPDICVRPFLARCLYELEPALVLPGFNIKVSTLTASMGTAGMRRLPAMTVRIRGALV